MVKNKKKKITPLNNPKYPSQSIPNLLISVIKAMRSFCTNNKFP